MATFERREVKTLGNGMNDLDGRPQPLEISLLYRSSVDVNNANTFHVNQGATPFVACLFGGYDGGSSSSTGLVRDDK
jgi:hypothetical protein